MLLSRNDPRKEQESDKAEAKPAGHSELLHTMLCFGLSRAVPSYLERSHCSRQLR
jgi:hypothetical protein